jgi:hypothetical protein
VARCAECNRASFVTLKTCHTSTKSDEAGQDPLMQDPAMHGPGPRLDEDRATPAGTRPFSTEWVPHFHPALPASPRSISGKGLRQARRCWLTMWTDRRRRLTSRHAWCERRPRSAAMPGAQRKKVTRMATPTQATDNVAHAPVGLAAAVIVPLLIGKGRGRAASPASRVPFYASCSTRPSPR